MPKSQTYTTDFYPLPAMVGYKNHDLRKQRSPNYSFGRRTHIREYVSSPGPAIYDTSKQARYGISKANQYTMAEKLNIIDKRISPGPMAYQLRDCASISSRYSYKGKYA